MAWNDSDKDKDPWGGKKNPPDLDAILQSFFKKIKASWTTGGNHTPSPSTSSGSPLPISLSVIFFVIFLLWGLSGIYIVDPPEQAVVLRFGEYVKTVGPGPHWIPRFFYSKLVYNVERVSDYSYSAKMLTQDENLVSVSLAVQYRIGDLKDYLFNTSDPQESLKQATSSALRQVVGNTTLDQIITEGREAWGSSVQENLVNILKEYQTGILIVNVSPQPARAPEQVQDAFDDAIKAQEDEKRFKEQAYAYEASVVPIAEGNAKRIFEEAQASAKQVVLKAKGEVAEFLSILPIYQRSPQVTSERLYLESIQEVLSKNPAVVVDTKASNLLYLPIPGATPVSPPSLPSSLVANTSSLSSDNADMLGDALHRSTSRETERPTVREE